MRRKLILQLYFIINIFVFIRFVVNSNRNFIVSPRTASRYMVNVRKLKTKVTHNVYISDGNSNIVRL